MNGVSQTISSQPSLWQRLWRRPELTVARFLLVSHIRSGWIVADIVYIWFLYAFLFLEYGGDVLYFYGTVGLWLGLLAVLDTIVMMQRSFKTARIYLPISHLTSRAVYIRGLIIATSFLRIPLFFLILLLAAGFHRATPNFGIQGATLANMVPGAIGLLINCVLLATFTVLLSLPIATRGIQIIFLIWVVAVLYANGNHGDLVAHYLSVSLIPLAPVLASYNMGATLTINPIDWLLLLITIGYILVTIVLIETWLRRRDLIFF